MGERLIGIPAREHVWKSGRDLDGVDRMQRDLQRGMRVSFRGLMIDKGILLSENVAFWRGGRLIGEVNETRRKDWWDWRS